MLRDFVVSSLEKKNTLMLITSLVFILGTVSFFNNWELPASIFLTLLVVIFILKSRVSIKIIFMWLLVFYIGFFNAYLRIDNSDELSKIAPKDGEITGRVISIPNSNVSDKTKFFLAVEDIDGEKYKSKTYVTISSKDGDFSMFNIGNKYKIKGKLRTPFKASNPSQFDYGRYLRNFDTFTVLYADKTDCKIISSELPMKWKFMQGLNNVRNRIIKVHSKYLKSPNLEILGGIVFGDDAVAPPDYVKDSFTNSGLLHILAASGMNVAFIFGFWFYLTSLLKIPYRPRVLSGMAVIILYTLMTGLGPSVIRASLMLLFVLFGKLIDRDSHSIALLSFVAMLMLIYNPAFVNDVGFQLSFLVTFGIICTANVLIDKFKGNKIKEFIAGTLLIPIVAQIWVIPLQMFYFNTISTYSFFANVSIMPFLSVISFGGFISSVLSIITPIANFICGISDFILNIFLTILVAISNFFASCPYSLIETFHPSVLQVFLYYVIVLFLTLMIKQGCTKRHIVILVALTAIMIFPSLHLPNGKLEIITFDVGNADAFLIKTPAEQYIILDTGKAPYKDGKSQGEYIIRKYLKDRGIKDVKIMLLTHFDTDHCGGAEDLLSRLKIDKVYVNSTSDTSKTAQNIYKKSTDTEVPSDGGVIYTEPDFTVKTYLKTSKDENESSIITLITYKDFDILLAGDAGVESLHRISKELPNDIEVFKAGHHGAFNSVDEDFMESHSPKVTILSTGKNNYGHPSPLTLDILNSTKIFRTDRHNSVKISTDGNKYEVYTFDIGLRRYILKYQENAK